MKKIGLSVCYDTNNFGSQLQVLATIKKIESLGYPTEIIVYKKKFSFKFILQQLPRLFNSYFIKGKIKGIKKRKGISRNKEVEKNVNIRNERFKQFRNSYFTNLSQPYVGWKNLVEESEKNYDTFLCGSDQLWLPSNLESHFYTLDFVANDKNKISYATSFGVSEIPWYQRNRTKKYLNKFNYLSTRETKGAEIIKNFTGINAELVCDPTLLFSASEWSNILKCEKLISEKYIFCYFLGENQDHRKAAEILKNKTGFKLVTIPFLDNYVESDKNFGDYKLFDVDAKDFVNLIRNAEYVLTDSFHGSIFSILNHKKFIVFNRFNDGKGSRNSRIDSLCDLLGLNQRRFSGNIVSEIDKEIDYETVDKKLTKFRDDSISYLSKALKNK